MYLGREGQETPQMLSGHRASGSFGLMPVTLTSPTVSLATLTVLVRPRFLPFPHPQAATLTK